MIHVTRINKKDTFWINEDLIEFIEETPDTVISLNTGRRVLADESALMIIDKIREERAVQSAMLQDPAKLVASDCRSSPALPGEQAILM